MYAWVRIYILAGTQQAFAHQVRPILYLVQEVSTDRGDGLYYYRVWLGMGWGYAYSMCSDMCVWDSIDRGAEPKHAINIQHQHQRCTCDTRIVTWHGGD
jgi:hypothetical protein